jgi:hypothetical protein
MPKFWQNKNGKEYPSRFTYKKHKFLIITIEKGAKV